MLVSGRPLADAWGYITDFNFECESCGRSLEERFGGIPPNECDSCLAEYDLLLAADNIQLEQG